MEMHSDLSATPYPWEADWRAAVGEHPDEKGKYVELRWEDHDAYLDKAKHSRLPVIEEKLTFPHSDRNCLILQIFDNPGWDSQLPEKTFFKSALWSIRSFLKHSDLADSDFSVKFFVEAHLEDRFRPYLEACGRSVDDCIFFEDTFIDQRNHYSSRLYMWFHEALLKYENVLLLDADIFAKRLNSGEKAEIFKSFSNLKSEQIAVWFQKTANVPEHYYNLENWLSEYQMSSAEDYRKLVFEATDKGKDIRNDAELLDLSGKLTWLPIQWFNQTYPDYKHWANAWINRFFIDEGMNAAYLYGFDVPYFNIGALYNYPISHVSAFRARAIDTPFIDICFGD